MPYKERTESLSSILAEHRLFHRRGVLGFACLSLTLVACATVPESSEDFVVLESSKFT